MASPDFLRTKTLKQDVYNVEESKSLGTSGTLNVHLDNPADSGKMLYIESIEVYYDESVTVTLHEDVDSVSGGSNVEIENNYLGGKASVADATADVTFNSIATHVVISMPNAQSVPVDILSQGRIVMPEGRDIVIDVLDNGGGGANEVTVQMTIVEINT